MKYAMALDIGGTRIKYMLVSSTGDILLEASESTLPEGNPLPLSKRLEQIAGKMVDYAQIQKLEIAGIGVGVPSIVEKGRILFTNNLPELNNQVLEEAFSDLGLPVFIDNDANLMGLGEVTFGAGRGLSDSVFLTVGTGIGGAFFLNGRLYSGYRNRGAEPGHLIIQGKDGNPCSCGASGCLEAHASIGALITYYQQVLHENKREIPLHIDGKLIVARYRAQEKEARLAMEEHFRSLSIGIASLIHLFAPQKVIVGGGISESGAFYIQQLQRRVQSLTMPESARFTTLETAHLGNKAGCLGAAALVFNT